MLSAAQLLETLMLMLHTVGWRHRATLAKMVASIWLTGTLSVASMARGAAIRFEERPRMLHKAFDRLLGSTSVDSMTLYKAQVLSLIAPGSRVHIAVDWFSLRKDSVRVLLASLCNEDGRAWPLAALTIATSDRKALQCVTESRMIAWLRDTIPDEVTVIILADRGFDGAKFRVALRAAKFHYILRVRGNLLAFTKHKKRKVRELAGTRRQTARRHEAVLLTAQKDAVGAIVTCWDKKSKGPWLLMTNLAEPAEAIVDGYALRFRIEEAIRDLKNIRLGLGLEEVRTHSLKRWSMLLAIAIVGYTIVRRCGVIARQQGLAKDFSTSGRRPHSHSTFSLGKFHANASPDILRLALALTPSEQFMRAA